MAEADDAAEGGRLILGVASHDGEMNNGLILTDGNVEDEVDVTVGNGTASIITIPGHIDLAGDIDVDGTANLDNTDIDGTFTMDGTAFDVNATTTCLIDNSNTSNGVAINTVTSGGPVTIGHATSETTVNDNLTVTGDLSVNGDTTTFASANANDPLVIIKNTTDDTDGAMTLMVLFSFTETMQIKTTLSSPRSSLKLRFIQTDRRVANLPFLLQSMMALQPPVL